MSETSDVRWRGGWLNRLVARPGFQSWAARFPLTRRKAEADGAALFELVQGFVASQVLFALVELDVLTRLKAGAQTAEDLGALVKVQPSRMQVLLQAGAALGLLKRRRGNRYGLSRLGAASLGVPGLMAMIRHHAAFFEDLRDPVALLRAEGSTRLSGFWPYVFGAEGEADPETVALYSDLMAQSQRLVAEDTLRRVKLNDVDTLLDVGGGRGVFLAAAQARWPHLKTVLFDLPEVVRGVGKESSFTVHEGSFRSDPLPEGADAISLVRVLYDHSDDTVRVLLKRIHEALPVGGRLIVSEPMGGGTRPDRAGDVYFAFYTMAMQTGKTRSAEEIESLCREAGFGDVKSPAPIRPYVTRVLTARKA